MYRALLILVFLFVTSPSLADDCDKHLPYGRPSLSEEINITVLCKRGYGLAHDDDNLVPRWVAYKLTAQHTLGCEQRKNNFHPEQTLPEDHRATPKDYVKSGYDKGHMAPAGDFTWSKAMMSDTFSMANMSPQLPGLNRQEWERLEEVTRTWASDRGELAIAVGPVLATKPKHIGTNEVAIPSAFWKVIVDTKTTDTLAFIMPQKDIAKGPLEPWQTSVADVERAAEIQLPLPPFSFKDEKPALWPADVAAWNAKRKEACAR